MSSVNIASRAYIMFICLSSIMQETYHVDQKSTSSESFMIIVKQRLPQEKQFFVICILFLNVFALVQLPYYIGLCTHLTLSAENGYT